MVKTRQVKNRKKKAVATAQPIPSKNRTIYFVAFLVLLVLVLYGQTIGYDFVYDDVFAITENYITQQGWHGLSTIWTEHYRFGYHSLAAELYRPLPLSLFAIEWSISPNNPSIHHLINVLCYALTAWLLFLTIQKVFQQSTLVSFLGSLFFIAHPLHTEVVTNIKSRDEILAFLFLILALRFFWKYSQKKELKPLMAALFTYLLALFSKESAITFLAIFPLTLFFFGKKSLQQIVNLSLPFLVPTSLFLLMRYNAIGSFGNNAPPDELHNLLVGASSMSDQIATAFLILGKYLSLLVFPHPLNSDAGFGAISITNWVDWKVILSLLIHLGLFVFAVTKLKKRHFLAFCILFYGITLSLNSNLLLMIGSSYGERFLFTPSLGFCLALAFLLEKYLSSTSISSVQGMADFLKHYQKTILISSFLLVLYSFKTLDRATAWQTNLTLVETDLISSPNSVQLNYNYGVELLKSRQTITNAIEKKQKIDLAKNTLTKAIRQYPNHAEAYGQLGLAHYLEGNYQAAIDNYQLANQFKSNDPKVYNNMGMLHYINKDLEQAQIAYEKAIALDAKMDEAYRNLGGILLVKKEYQQAIENYKTALQFDPHNAEVHYFMGLAYLEQGDTLNAQPLIEKAYAIDPTLKNQ